MSERQPSGFEQMLPSISTGTGIVGSILSPIMQHFQNKANRKFAIEQRDYNNWYNSPEQQMARLKDAGLNPNLVYGSGNAIVSSSSAQSQGQAPKADVEPIQRALYQWQDYALKELKSNQLEKLIKLAQENTLLAREKTESQAIKNNLANSLFDTSIDMYEERLRNQRLRNTGQAYQNQLALQEWQIRDIMKQPNLDKTLAEIANIKARSAVIPAQIDQIHASAENLRSSAEYRNLQKDQLSMIKNDLHEALIIQNRVNRGQADKNELEAEKLRISNSWRQSGMSETFVQDMLQMVLGGFIGKK